MRPRWLDSVHRAWMLYHLAGPHFAFLYEPPPESEWVTLDCETTGLDVHRDQIISIEARASRKLFTGGFILLNGSMTVTPGTTRQRHLLEQMWLCHFAQPPWGAEPARKGPTGALWLAKARRHASLRADDVESSAWGRT